VSKITYIHVLSYLSNLPRFLQYRPAGLKRDKMKLLYETDDITGIGAKRRGPAIVERDHKPRRTTFTKEARPNGFATG